MPTNYPVASAGAFVWTADDFVISMPNMQLVPTPLNYSKLSNSEIPTSFQPSAEISIVGNGIIYPNASGHFQVLVTTDIGYNSTLPPVTGASRCISAGERSDAVQQAIANIMLNVTSSAANEIVPLSSLFAVLVSKFGDGSHRSNYTTTYKFLFKPITGLNSLVDFSFDKSKCGQIRYSAF